MRTGDIGTVNAEGFYFILDRKKDMFISGGENVYPAEIEGVIAEIPGVVEVAVIGVADWVAQPDRAALSASTHKRRGRKWDRDRVMNVPSTWFG